MTIAMDTNTKSLSDNLLRGQSEVQREEADWDAADLKDVILALRLGYGITGRHISCMWIGFFHHTLDNFGVSLSLTEHWMSQGTRYSLSPLRSLCRPLTLSKRVYPANATSEAPHGKHLVSKHPRHDEAGGYSLCVPSHVHSQFARDEHKLTVNRYVQVSPAILPRESHQLLWTRGRRTWKSSCSCCCRCLSIHGTPQRWCWCFDRR